MISPVLALLVNCNSGKGRAAGPWSTFPVAASYLEPWHGQISCPSISWLILQPACVHLFEKILSVPADFTTINVSNKNMPVPSFEPLIRFTTGISDNCFCRPVNIVHKAIKAAAKATVASLRNVFLFIYLLWFKSVFIKRQNYKDFSSMLLPIFSEKPFQIILFYVSWQFLFWAVIYLCIILIFNYI